jgi:hypothetical protein
VAEFYDDPRIRQFYGVKNGCDPMQEFGSLQEARACASTLASLGNTPLVFRCELVAAAHASITVRDVGKEQSR